MSDIDEAVLKFKANTFDKLGPEEKSFGEKDRPPFPEHVLERARITGRKDGIDWASWPGLDRHHFSINCCDEERQGCATKKQQGMEGGREFWAWLRENYAQFIEHIESIPDRDRVFISWRQWAEWKKAFDGVCKEIYLASGGYIPKDPPSVYQPPLGPPYR